MQTQSETARGRRATRPSAETPCGEPAAALVSLAAVGALLGYRSVAAVRSALARHGVPIVRLGPGANRVRVDDISALVERLAGDPT